MTGETGSSPSSSSTLGTTSDPTGIGSTAGVDSGVSTTMGESFGTGTTVAGPDSSTSGGNTTASDTGTAADPAIPSEGCGQPRTLENGMRTITSDGIERTYFLQTPQDYDATRPHRLIFMFHWNFGSINAIVNPPDADQNTDRPFYGMGDLVDDQTIFVVPQGLISNTGGAGWQNTGDQDVRFTDDMLDEVASDLCIDRARVFATGFSFGAAMSSKLACARADVFRAAVVYNAGPLSGNDPDECTAPIAFFQSHGIDDPIIQYPVGLSVFNVFADVNGCTAMTPPDPPQDGHTCVSYEGCSVPTRFCNFGPGEGNPSNPSLQGHYPSAKDPGEETSWIPAEAWAFITQF